MRNFLRQVKGLMTSRPAGMDDLFAQTNWAVVGSHGRNPIASQLVEKLKSNNKNTYTVNPSLGKQSDNNKSAQLPSAQYKSLSDVLEDGKKVDVVNLVINPVKGIEVVKEMANLNINKLFIQPGAASEDILQFCKDHDIAVVQGCVLVSM